MAIVDNKDLEKIILQKFEKAKRNVLNESIEYAENVSNNIPGYDIDKLEFGGYKKDSFVCLFADMRDSTKRALDIGAKDTFLTIHAIMPAMIHVVQAYGGSIVDLPGDGVMVLFKGNPKNITRYPGETPYNTETLAVRAGERLLEVFEEVVNPILEKNEIEPVFFGVGIDTGEVIVTKVGTDEIRDIKAIGNCINNASKNSFGENEMFISTTTYTKIENWVKQGFKEACRPKDEEKVVGFLKKI